MQEHKMSASLSECKGLSHSASISTWIKLFKENPTHLRRLWWRAWRLPQPTCTKQIPAGFPCHRCQSAPASSRSATRRVRRRTHHLPSLRCHSHCVRPYTELHRMAMWPLLFQCTWLAASMSGAALKDYKPHWREQPCGWRLQMQQSAEP